MLEFLPQDLRLGLEMARKKSRRGARLHLQVGEAVFPVLRLWQGGFSLDSDLAPGRLRGLVDLYDGPRHILQCLIVAAEYEAGELVCLFKRATLVTDRAAADYWQGEHAPLLSLPRN